MKGSELDKPPPGDLLKTETLIVPAEASCASLIWACRVVLLITVVVQSTPFQRAVEAEFTKFVPFTVGVNPAPPCKAAAGFNSVMVGSG